MLLSLILFSASVCFYIFLLISIFRVGLNIEVKEEEEEHTAVEENDVTEDFWEITFDKQREGSVKEEGNKLNQLKGSQVPEIEIN